MRFYLLSDNVMQCCLVMLSSNMFSVLGCATRGLSASCLPLCNVNVLPCVALGCYTCVMHCLVLFKHVF